MFGNTITLVFGVGLGIYVAQNYDVPDIKVIVERGIKAARSIEKATRKEENEK